MAVASLAGAAAGDVPVGLLDPAGPIERVHDREDPSAGLANLPALSADCRRLAWFHRDRVYVQDRATGTDLLASLASRGEPIHGVWPALDLRGRIAIFGSFARDPESGARATRLAPVARDLAAAATLRPGGCDTFLVSPYQARSLSGDGRALLCRTHGDTAGGADQLHRLRLPNGRPVLVSATPGGTPANDDSTTAALDYDGEVVAFASRASDLAAEDDDADWDVFVRDLRARTTRLVSRGIRGGSGNGASDAPALDLLGRTLAFASDASNLVVGDRNGVRDVFVFDRATGRTTRVSRGRAGNDADGPSDHPVLSGDGRLVAFVSSAANLVPGDRNGWSDVFVHDRATRRTVRVSGTWDGAEGDEESGPTGVALAADGSCVVFESWASNLVPDDSNREPDVFLRELRPPVWRR